MLMMRYDYGSHERGLIQERKRRRREVLSA